MLKKIELGNVSVLRDYNTYERIQRLSFERIFEGAEEYEKAGTSKDASEVEKIILNYINIQHGLSLYVLKISEDATDREKSEIFDDIETINLISGIPEKEQLIAARKIFRDVAIYQDEEENTLEIKVINPSETAINAFKKLYSEHRLNSWLQSIMWPYEPDCKKVSAYQSIPSFSEDTTEEDIEKVMIEFEKDPFVRYLLEGEKNRKIKRQVKIGGSLEDIGSSAFFNLFPYLVHSLYVYVEKEKHESGKKQFNKYFTWFEIGEDQSKYSEEDLAFLCNAIGFIVGLRTPTGARIKFYTEEEFEQIEQKQAERIERLFGEKNSKDK